MLEPAKLGGGEPTIGSGHDEQLHDGPTTRFYEPDNRGETLGRTVNVHLSKVQPGWDLQQHVHDIPVGAVDVAEYQLPTKSPPQVPPNPQQLPPVSCVERLP